MGKGENGDLGEIELVRARQRKEQIEGPFKALDIDNEGIACGRLAGLLPRL